MGKLTQFAGTKKEAMTGAAVVLGAAGGIAFLNHKLGAGEIKLLAAADGSGGLPLDGLLGIAGLGFAFFRPESRFASLALGIGLGSGAGFLYRAGAAAGDKAAVAAAQAAKTTTSGNPHQLGQAFAPFSVGAHPNANRSSMGHAVRSGQAHAHG